MELEEAERILDKLANEDFAPCNKNSCDYVVCNQYWEAIAVTSVHDDSEWRAHAVGVLGGAVTSGSRTIDDGGRRALILDKYQCAAASFSHLDDTISGQMGNAHEWLREKLTDEIDGKYQTFTYNRDNQQFTYNVSDLVNEIQEEWRHSVEDMPDAYNDLTFAEAFYGWVLEWNFAYSCTSLRKRVRDNIESKKYILEVILVDHYNRESGETIDGWRDFVTLVWDSLQYGQKMSPNRTWHSIVTNIEQVESEKSYFSSEESLGCPFCTNGTLSVHKDVQFKQPINLAYRTGDWREMHFRIKCDNSYCGFHYSDDDGNRDYLLHGLLWANPVSEPDLDDLMKDEYFLTWVH